MPNTKTVGVMSCCVFLISSIPILTITSWETESVSFALPVVYEHFQVAGAKEKSVLGTSMHISV